MKLSYVEYRSIEISTKTSFDNNHNIMIFVSLILIFRGTVSYFDGISNLKPTSADVHTTYTHTYLGLLRYLHDRRLLSFYGQIHVVSSPCWRRGLVVVDDRLSAPMFVQPVLKRQHTRSTDNLFWQTIPHLYAPMWKAHVSYIYIVSFFMNFPDMAPRVLSLWAL